MKKKLEYEVLLNCILIDENVRECFLFWCKKTHKISQYIHKLFPNLCINKFESNNKFQFETSDVLLISKRIINPGEYNTDEKLGKLLGYLSANNYIKLDRNLTMYNYVVIAIINDIEIHLFDELSQNKLYYEEIRQKIENAFIQNKLGIDIQGVSVKERVILSSN